MQLLSPNNFFGENMLIEYRFHRCYTLHGSYLIKTSPDFLLEPGLVVRVSEDLRKQVDINISGMYKEIYRLGISTQ